MQAKGDFHTCPASPAGGSAYVPFQLACTSPRLPGAIFFLAKPRRQYMEIASLTSCGSMRRRDARLEFVGKGFERVHGYRVGRLIRKYMQRREFSSHVRHGTESDKLGHEQTEFLTSLRLASGAAKPIATSPAAMRSKHSQPHCQQRCGQNNRNIASSNAAKKSATSPAAMQSKQLQHRQQRYSLLCAAYSATVVCSSIDTKIL